MTHCNIWLFSKYIERLNDYEYPQYPQLKQYADTILTNSQAVYTSRVVEFQQNLKMSLIIKNS